MFTVLITIKCFKRVKYLTHEKKNRNKVDVGAELAKEGFFNPSLTCLTAVQRPREGAQAPASWPVCESREPLRQQVGGLWLG